MSGRSRGVVAGIGMLIMVPALLNPATATGPDASPSLSSTDPWAPASEAAIRPGLQTVTDGGQCTANFVFTDAAGAVYLGQAAHCSGTGGATETNGCDSESLPLGTPVTVKGASKPGRLAYNSWLTMQAKGETDENACEFNDFALVEIHPHDVAEVNPSVPFFGGPVDVARTAATLGRSVYSYGNSGLRLGISALSPKFGVSLGTAGAGWSHVVYTATPGIPGDSGSAFLDADGNALGVLSTVQLLPLAGSNGVGDLSRELAYLNAHSGLPTVTLVPGTEPFAARRLL